MKTEEKIKVLVADDNTAFLRNLGDYISSQEDMEVVALARNGEEAVELILEKRPDIALIDLIMPLKDGFGVLEDLRSKEIIETSCILISAVALDNMAVKALSLGAKYFVVKPYRTEFLAGRIRQIYKETQDNPMENKNFDYSDFYIPKEPVFALEESTSTEHYISQILNRLSISASIKGYFYLRTGIMMVVKDQEAIIGITKRMYPDIAKEYKTTSSKVERAIRHAIESAWKKGAGKFYCEMIGVECEGKPTNGQFIAAIGEYLRLNPRQIRTA